jgi:hypothetical protein
MNDISQKEKITKLLREKSCMKQDVFAKTKEAFQDLKVVLNELVDELKVDMHHADNRVEVGYKSRGHYEAELRFAGDVLLFHMHTNVFDFDKSHPIWKTSYANENEYNTFCGIINVYNFLSDSLKFNRVNDSGYLVARIFINREGHFFVEGKKQLGFMYNDFMNSNISKVDFRKIAESAMLFSLNFDLLTPPYDSMREISVHEVDQLTNQMKLKTAKRLGFKFDADEITIKDKK